MVSRTQAIATVHNRHNAANISSRIVNPNLEKYQYASQKNSPPQTFKYGQPQPCSAPTAPASTLGTPVPVPM